MAKLRNFKINPPESLTELSKDSMLAYVKELGKDDAIWFAKLCRDNKVEKTYQFTSKNGSFKAGDKYEGYDMPVIRKAFAAKYFPQLLEKKKSKTKPSFDKELEEILAAE